VWGIPGNRVKGEVNKNLQPGEDDKWNNEEEEDTPKDSGQ